MSASSSTMLSRLSPGDIAKLTKLLTYTPPAGNSSSTPHSAWLSTQHARLKNSTLPSSLLRPTSLLSRLKASLSTKSSTTTFCSIHEPLNPHLIHHIFLLVVSETSTRLVRLTTCSDLPPHIEAFIKRLRSLNSLWMSPELYRVSYEVQPQETRYERIESGCEACILSFIGGNSSVLSDLRASLLGRKKKRHEEPRLLNVVENWTSNLRREQEENVLDESEILAREVRRLRNRLRQERKENAREMQKPRRDMHQGSDDEELLLNPFEYQIQEEEIQDVESQRADTDAENDPETAIIDYYAGLVSSTHLPLPNQTHGHSSTYGRTEAKTNHVNNDRESKFAYRGVRESDIHPAFRDSIIFLPETGTFARREEEVISPLTRVSSPRPSASSRSRSISQMRSRSKESNRQEERESDERRRKNRYTASVYSNPSSSHPFSGPSTSSSLNFSTTTISAREDSESQAKLYRNLVETNDMEDTEEEDSLIESYRSVDNHRRRERKTRWGGFSGFNGGGTYSASTNV